MLMSPDCISLVIVRFQSRQNKGPNKMRTSWSLLWFPAGLTPVAAPEFWLIQNAAAWVLTSFERSHNACSVLDIENNWEFFCCSTNGNQGLRPQYYNVILLKYQPWKALRSCEAAQEGQTKRADAAFNFYAPEKVFTDLRPASSLFKSRLKVILSSSSDDKDAFSASEPHLTLWY